MLINLVAAVSDNFVIGVDNGLPWSLKDDLRFFKKITTGKPIVMGRNTWRSLGRPLPGRLNVVLSRSLADIPEDVLLFPDWAAARAYLEKEGYEEISIIGGGILYAHTMPDADVLFLTRVHTEIRNPGAVYFPEFREDDWELEWEEFHPADEEHIYPFTFQKWIKKRKGAV